MRPADPLPTGQVALNATRVGASRSERECSGVLGVSPRRTPAENDGSSVCASGRERLDAPSTRVRCDLPGRQSRSTRLAPLLLLALAACSAPAGEPGADPADPADPDPTDTAAPDERPRLTTPAEAVDTDPSATGFLTELRAAPATLLVDGVEVEGYAYGGQVPGPTIRVRVGDTFTGLLQNDLPDATTVHWHGQRVPESMDGAGWVDGGVLPGTAFTYTFTAEHAGTFWYHPHLDVGHQVDAGLYGAFIVEDPADPPADRELVVVFDAWDEDDPAALGPEDGTAGADHDHALADPARTVWTVNGLVDPVYEATAGERIRVRTINASNTAYLALQWPEMRLLATDQGLLGWPEYPDHVVLAPGDRAEFEWTIGASFDVETLPFVASGGAALGDPRRLFSVEVPTSGDAPTPIEWPAGDTVPTADPAHTDLVYVFQGGGDGEWLIDGAAWPDVTPKFAALGADTVIEVRNLSATNHPFHLHGQVFEVLSVDGAPVPDRRVEDTIDVGIRQTVRLLLRADNPGSWLLHCHLLGHEEGGMMTVLTVE